MAELICVGKVEIGNTIYDIGDRVTCAGITNYKYDKYEEEFYYMFYGDYNYDLDSWDIIYITTDHFMTPAEWRDYQIDNILKD